MYWGRISVSDFVPYIYIEILICYSQAENNDDEGAKGCRDAWGLFVNILSNETFDKSCEALIDFLKTAVGFLDREKHIFLSKPSDSRQTVVSKRHWLRWLIRRLLSLCHVRKGWPKILEGCQATLTLIMKKAGEDEPQLFGTLIDQYIIFLKDLEHSSDKLHIYPGEDECKEYQDPIKLRSFASEWNIRAIGGSAKEYEDPYETQNKSSEIVFNYGHESERLREIVTDVLSSSFASGHIAASVPSRSKMDIGVALPAQVYCILPQRINDVWRLLIRQLNIAQLNVKRSTLNFMAALFRAGNTLTSTSVS